MTVELAALDRGAALVERDAVAVDDDAPEHRTVDRDVAVVVEQPASKATSEITNAAHGLDLRARLANEP